MDKQVQPIQVEQQQSVLAPLVDRFTDKIHDFFTLFVYEMNELSAFEMEKILAENIDVFDSTMFLKKFKVYILSADNYYANEQLYITIRHQAREKVISNFIQFAVLYSLQQRPHVTLSAASDSAALLTLFKNVEGSLIQKVRGREIASWKDYNTWWKRRITEKTIEDLIVHFGLQQLERVSNDELNHLFLEALTKNLTENQDFLARMNEESKYYYQNFVTLMLQEVNDILAQYDVSSHRLVEGVKDFAHLTAVPNYISVANFVIYQAIREVMYQKQFSQSADAYPVTTFSKGQTTGKVEIMPFGIDDVTEQGLQQAQQQVAQLSTIDVDVLDILCTLFLYRAKHPSDVIDIHISDILKMRGLMEKLGGKGRRGGFEKKQKEQIITALQNIQSLWVTVEQTTLYKQNKPTKAKAQGRVFLFQTADGKAYNVANQTCSTKISYTVDTLFATYFMSPKKQLTLLPIPALKYHAYRMSAEKQLSRYLSWRWRTQAFKGNYLQPNKVRTLLEAMGEALNERAPMRTRERLEKTLDTLARDEIIADWHYVKWDEQIATTKGWAKYWLNTSIVIEPADQVKEHYATIEQKNRYRASRVDEPTKDEKLGQELALKRKQQSLTILQLAEILGVTAPHISNIEKSKSRPSVQLRKKMERWLRYG